MNLPRLIVFLCLVTPAVTFARSPQAGAEAEVAAPDRLIVATKVAEPFVIERDGELDGLSIDLWRRVAERMDLVYEFQVTTLPDLLDGVADGRFDAGIAAISVTPEREEQLDLTHGYFMDGLGIAVPTGGGGPAWARGFANVFTSGFASAAGGLAVVLLIVGVLIWIVERRRNAEQFGGDATRGIGAGFWFAAVTMTTVGYGDKAPQSLAGRLIALVWMFASIIVISAFTGAIASSLTAAQITGAVRAPEDLRSARVGAPAGSATVEALRERGVTPRTYETLDAGIDALRSGGVDAFVHDRAILEYRLNRYYPGELNMLEAQMNVGSYAIALPSGSPLRERMNREVLAITREPAWQDAVARYLGGGGS